MVREIDILFKAAGKGCAVVAKESNIFLTWEELLEADKTGAYQDEDCLASPTEQIAVSGLFPGCLQQYAMREDYTRYRLVGQTEHFLIFAPPETD